MYTRALTLEIFFFWAGMFLGAGVASSLAQVTWPMIAPEHLRYSQYQLGLGARCVCVSVQGLGFRV